MMHPCPARGAARSAAKRCTADAGPRFGSNVDEACRQIAPVWISGFDQLKLPLSAPAFERAFPRSRFQNRFILLKIDQPIHLISLCETKHGTRFVLSHAAGQVVG